MKRCHWPCCSTKDGQSLPSYDALAQILPDNTTTAGKTEAPQSNNHINQTYQKHTPHKRAPLPDFEDDLQNKAPGIELGRWFQIPLGCRETSVSVCRLVIRGQ
ncbi:hypothetical protein J4Q44_G00209050 [Coregonus suidteri]|uniref:Uncharacterized protein n=1 Tax=Coregonus suidteri TaxID=861788 RepID=A0AAN8R204_9TELE